MVAFSRCNYLLTAVLFAFSFIASCAGSGGGRGIGGNIPPAKMDTIVLAPDQASLEKGRSLDFAVFATPFRPTNTTISWASSDSSIVSVSRGVATANADSGSAIITATANDGSGVKGISIITAIPTTIIKATNIVVSPQNASVKKGGTLKLRSDVTNDGSGVQGTTTVTATNSLSSSCATPCIIMAASDAVGNGDGSSWADAVPSLQGALDIAKTRIAAGTPKVQIFLKAGIYKPEKSATGSSCVNNKRNCSFVMQNDVEIYGGFAGTERALTERTLSASSVTYLDGLHSGSKCSDTNAVCSRGVVWNSYAQSNPLTASALLDGVTIRNGKVEEGYGGGLSNIYASPTITNVILSANTANKGGGMYNKFSSPTLTNVTFSANTANQCGGGMYNAYYSSPTLTNVIFSANKAGWNGGGMYNVFSSSPTLTNVTFSANTAWRNGGGMFNISSSSPTLTNVTFSANTARTNNGGGMFNISEFTDVAFSSPTLTDVTFSGNTAGSEGGGMCNTYYSSPTLINVTFSGNAAKNGGGGGMYNNSRSSLSTLINVTFSGNTARGGSKSIGNNSGAYTALVNTLVWGKTAFVTNYTTYFSQIIGVKAGTTNRNIDGTGASPNPFGSAGLADNGNPFSPTIALSSNSPAYGAGALIWKFGTAYYAAKGSDVYKLTGTGTGKLPAGSTVPTGAILISKGGANKNNTVTPAASPAIYPDIGAYQH